MNAIKKKVHGRGRNTTIDILRLVFAMIIVIHHSRYVVGYDNCPFAGGSFGVEFFFLVSGYLMMASALRADKQQADLGKETIHFLLRKGKGILPEFFISWTIGFVFVCLSEGYHGIKIWHVLRDDIWEITFVKMSGIFTGGLNGVMWYLSSMLLCMAVLYPLLRRFPSMTRRVIMPLTALLLLGYLCRQTGHPRNPTEWLGFTYKGNIRAMAELCLGGVCYQLAEKLRGIPFKRWVRAALCVVEVLCYLAVIRYMYLERPSETDFFYLLVLMAGVTLSFSEVGRPKGKERSAKWEAFAAAASDYSTAVFFGHLYLAQHIISLSVIGQYSDEKRLTVYLILSVLNGFIIMLLAKAVKYNLPRWKDHLQMGLLEKV